MTVFLAHLAAGAPLAMDRHERAVFAPRRLVLPPVGLLVFLAACSDSGVNDLDRQEAIPVVQLVAHSITLGVGDSADLHLLPMLPPGYVPPVAWSSSNGSVASVESVDVKAGRVRGVGPGQAVIRVSGDGAKDSASVTVTTDAGG